MSKWNDLAKKVGDEVKKDVQSLEAAAEKVEGEVKDEFKKVEAEVEAVVEKVVGWFKTKLGYPLHDHTQGVTITPAGVQAVKTPWVEQQMKAGLVVEVEPPAQPRPAPLANAAGAVPPLGFKFVGQGPNVVLDGFSPPAPVPPAGYEWNEEAKAYSPVKA